MFLRWLLCGTLTLDLWWWMTLHLLLHFVAYICQVWSFWFFCFGIRQWGFFFFFFLLNVPLVLGLTWLATSRLFQHWSLDIFFTIFLFNSHKIRYNLSNNILFFSLLSISLGQTKEYSISFLHHYLKKSNNIPTCCLVFQSLSCVWLVATPLTAACQASLPFTVSHCLFKFMSIELVMPSNHLMPCHPLLLLPSVFPSMRIFSNVSPLHQVTKVLELQL